MSILDLALVAHDTKKDALIAWAERHRSLLSGHRILATGTTGQRLKEAIPELKVERVLSGPLGGDLQIGARIAEKRVDALIFLIDPLWAQPHEPDVRALMRIAAVHDALAQEGLRLVDVRDVINRVVGLILPDNTGMRALAEELGFEIGPDPGESGVLRASLDLASPDSRCAA